MPLSPEELQAPARERRQPAHHPGQPATDVDGLGLYITDLLGKLPSEQLEELRQLLGDPDASAAPRRAALPRRARGDGAFFSTTSGTTTSPTTAAAGAGCTRSTLDGDSGEFFNQALGDYARLIPEVRRQFQRIRPEMYRTVRGLEDGEDFDLNAAIAARVDRARRPGAVEPKLYVARKREERDVATLFLVDMSASTDEPFAEADGTACTTRRRAASGAPAGKPRRIIDVTKEALVIMAEALEEIGDAYAHLRLLRPRPRAASSSIWSSRSTSADRDGEGPHRRHRAEAQHAHGHGAAPRGREAAPASPRARKHLILLSDGFPQDFDYGQDRRSNVYGIRDTAVALREAEAAGVTPFCITVDKAGHDYLREMCDELALHGDRRHHRAAARAAEDLPARRPRLTAHAVVPLACRPRAHPSARGCGRREGRGARGMRAAPILIT